MNKVFNYVVGATIVVALVLSATFGLQMAQAAAPDGAGPWADEVISFTQGLRDDASPVVGERSDATNALGVAEGTDAINFVALGYGGELVLRFDNAIFDGKGADLHVVETTYGDVDCEAYPEQVEVSVSADGLAWSPVHTGCQDTYVDLYDSGLACVQYVKLTDVTDAGDFSVNHITDGYDVDGVEALNYRVGDCEPEYAEIDIKKSVRGYGGEGPYIVEPGTLVTYIYWVTNPGNVELEVMPLDDTHCSPISGPRVGDDTDNDGLLDPDETWLYMCQQEIYETTTNKARVMAFYGEDGRVMDRDRFTVFVRDGQGPDVITICHRPGEDNQRTREILASNWDHHEGHGDYLGECVQDVLPTR